MQQGFAVALGPSENIDSPFLSPHVWGPGFIRGSLRLCVCVGVVGLLWPANWPPQTSNWIFLAVSTTTELSKPYPTYWDETRRRRGGVWGGAGGEGRGGDREWFGQRGVVALGEGGRAESESCCCCMCVFFMSGHFTGRLFTVCCLTLLGCWSHCSLLLPSSSPTLTHTNTQTCVWIHPNTWRRYFPMSVNRTWWKQHPVTAVI